MTNKKVNALGYQNQNEAMVTALTSSIKDIFPIEGKTKELQISNIRIEDNLDDYDFPSQRDAKVNRKSWTIPITADFKLIDTTTGKVIDKAVNKKIGNLPKITNRYTAIIDGNEYQTTNQFRRKSGVYSRIKKNGELEAEFNLSKGKNFKMMMDPASGVFYLIFNNRKYRVWTLLDLLGVKDETLKKAWGEVVLESNKRNALNTAESELKSIYKIIYGKESKNQEETVSGLVTYFTNGTKMSGIVNKLTLGTGFTHVDKNSLTATATKLLNINKGTEEPDERDSLIFKDFYAIDDLVSNYFDKNSKVLSMKLGRTMELRERINDMVRPTLFSEPVKRFFTVGDLSSTPPQTNPVTIYSGARKTTPMGTGGIESSHAVTMEMRNLHASHLGFLDGTDTPECYDEETSIRTLYGWKLVSDITKDDKIACRIDGILEYHKPEKVQSHKYTGVMYGYSDHNLDFLVTQNHFHWACMIGSSPDKMSKIIATDLHKKRAYVINGLEHDSYSNLDPAYYYTRDDIRQVYSVTVPGGTVYTMRNGKMHWSGNSGKVGISLGLASQVTKSGRDLLTNITDLKGSKLRFSPMDVYENTVGFPDQFKASPSGKITALKATVKAMKQGRTVEVPAKEVKYYFRTPAGLFATHTNLIPFLETTQGNRAGTGARMMTQALPLTDPDPNLVEIRRDKNGSFEDLFGKVLGPLAHGNGVITAIDDNYIYMKGDDKVEYKHGLYKNFPLNQDGFIDSKPIVKVGDRVKHQQVLTNNNYSKDGKLTLSKNLRTGYLSYKGLNYEDGLVITDTAAKKLTHETIHKENIYFSPKLTIFDKEKFNAWYPDVLTSEDFKKLSKDGIIKVGATVEQGSVLGAYLVEKEMDDLDNALKKLDKITFNQYEKRILEWTNADPGEVIEIKHIGRNTDIYIKAKHPSREGDKLSGLGWGNKGIITKIIPDVEAPHTLKGEPIEIMMSAEGVPGRMNIGQMLHTAAGKISKKTGKVYHIENFDRTIDDAAKAVIEDGKKAGVIFDETLTDGKDGKKIKNKIFVGYQPIVKLRHIIDKKEGSTSTGAYDVYERPSGKGSQKTGILDMYSYLAHGAKHNLKEMSTIKGRKNEDYWRDLQFGLPPSKPARNFVWDKMMVDLKGMGVNTEKLGNKVRITPLTDKDVKEMSNGEIIDPGSLLIGKNLLAKKGGLFDKKITGGAQGESWSHFKLAKRIPNPMFEDAIIKLLGLTEVKYANIMNGSEKFEGSTGPDSILKSLSGVKVKDRIKSVAEDLKDAPPTNVNKLNTTLKYLKALDNLKMSASEAYTMGLVPVTPPKFRPIYPLPSGDLMISDINKHYKDIGVVNNTFKANIKDQNLTKEKTIEAQKTLYDTVKALQGLIDPITYSKQKYKGFMKDFGQVKTGLVHGKAWSKTQDVSGRSTITVDPDLGINEIGVPRGLAYNMWKPFVIRELKSYGLKAAEAKKQYDEESDLAQRALQQVSEQRPVIVNRAPALHKHSVQAFKPLLAEGKSIRLNPLIFQGFNSDLDGDTMSIMTPVGIDAVEEAYDMVPSKILFKHGDNSLQPGLSKDYIFGLYKLSQILKSSGKSFKTIGDAKKAITEPTTSFKLNGKTMTLGQYYINKPLPKILQDYKRLMSSKESERLLTIIGKEYNSQFADVISTWKDLGFNYAHTVGHTMSITDFNMDKSFRNKIIKERLPKINKLKGAKRIDALNKMTLDIENAMTKQIQKSTNRIKDMSNSGSFSKKDSIRQIYALPGVLTDIKGDAVEVPVLKSYGEGLDTASFFNSLFAVRKGTVDRAVNTQDTGALTKSLLNVSRRTKILEEDCNSMKFIEEEIGSKDVLDRFVAVTIPGLVKRNDLVTPTILAKAKKLGINKLSVRSPLTCTTINGLCQQCYGLMPEGKVPSIGTNVGILEGQALTERSTQLTMQTFHCYHGGSLIQTEDGRLRTIKSLVDEDYTGRVRDRHNEWTQVVGTAKHEVTFDLGLLRTRGNDHIIAQKNHPMQIQPVTVQCPYCSSIQLKRYDKTRHECFNCYMKFPTDLIENNRTTEVITKEIKDIDPIVDAIIPSKFVAQFGSEASPWKISGKEIAQYITGERDDFDTETLEQLQKECGIDLLSRTMPTGITNYPEEVAVKMYYEILSKTLLYYRQINHKKSKKEGHAVYYTSGKVITSNYGLANQIYTVGKLLNLYKIFLNVRNGEYVVTFKGLNPEYIESILPNIYTTRPLNAKRLARMDVTFRHKEYIQAIHDYEFLEGENQQVYDLETRSGTLSVNGVWAHNSGGSALAKGGVLDGFPNIKRLLTVPEKVANKATLSLTNGIVGTIEKNSIGGYNIIVGGVQHIILPGQTPIVKTGDVVDKGDAISNGIIKPQELGELKNHLSAQKYIVNEMNDVFADKFNKRTFETVIRSVSDNAEITTAPKDSGFDRGDKTTISFVDSLNKNRTKEGLDKILYRPYFKSIDTINVDSSDWMTKTTTNRIKAAIRTGAAKGQYADLQGLDPVPSYIYGDDFSG